MPSSTQARQVYTELDILEVAFRAAPVGLCVLDLNFRYLIVNPYFTRMYGLREEDFLGRTVDEALPEPAPQILAHMQLALDRDGIVEREIALRDPASLLGGGPAREVIFLRTAQPVHDAEGKIFGIVVSLSDITERKRLDFALRASEEDLRYTVELTPHIPWTADRDGELTFISPRWNGLVGHKPGPVRMDGWIKALHPDDVNRASSLWFGAVRSGKPYDAEYRIQTPHGGWRWVRARAYPRRLPNGDILRWYGTVEDIHERKTIGLELQNATQELARRALQDHLTGLSNRRHFDQVLHGEMERTQRTERPLSLILMDIDHFKAFNDIAGHLLGDECLKAVAAKLADVIERPTDLVARFGGEEFAIVLPDTSLEGALLIAKRALSAISELRLHHSDSRVRGVTISAGVATHHQPPGLADHVASMSTLIAAADVALYRAKREGRNRALANEPLPVASAA